MCNATQYVNQLITLSSIPYFFILIGDGSSRVTLRWSGEQGSDYINASFIDVIT